MQKRKWTITFKQEDNTGRLVKQQIQVDSLSEFRAMAEKDMLTIVAVRDPGGKLHRTQIGRLS